MNDGKLKNYDQDREESEQHIEEQIQVVGTSRYWYPFLTQEVLVLVQGWLADARGSSEIIPAKGYFDFPQPVSQQRRMSLHCFKLLFQYVFDPLSIVFWISVDEHSIGRHYILTKTTLHNVLI